MEKRNCAKVCELVLYRLMRKRRSIYGRGMSVGGRRGKLLLCIP
jgi:hypothetical protein